MRQVWGFSHEGLNLSIYAPYQAKAGDSIAIRVRVEAQEDLRDVTIYVELRGSKEHGYDRWYQGWWPLSDVELSSGVVRDDTISISIPSDVDSGLIYGLVSCSWKSYEGWLTGWVDRYYENSINVAYLTNLLDEYNDYKASHSHTNDEYNDLMSKYKSLTSELGFSKTLNYILIATTAVFIVTTVYSAVRKRKPITEAK